MSEHGADRFDGNTVGEEYRRGCRVAAQAKEYGHSGRRELAYLVAHSVLHLLGYDHMDEGPQKALMRQHEEAAMEFLELGR